MDWKLIYRSPEQILGLTGAIPAAEMESASTFVEENENIVFLEVTRQNDISIPLDESFWRMSALGI